MLKANQIQNQKRILVKRQNDSRSPGNFVVGKKDIESLSLWSFENNIN